MISIVTVSLMAMLQLSDTTRVFPSIQGQNLDGRNFSLPGDFAGELNVVFIAFKREQQADVDSWMPTLDTLKSRYPTLRVYELPTLARRFRLMRPVIDGGMRGGIPDPAGRAATITLYIDKDPFKRALGFTREDRIQIVLVDKSGHVRWQRSGPSTSGLRIELEAQLRR